MATGKDYYRILGVGREADDRTIRDAYRQLARRYHPDVNPNDGAAEARFKEISEAHACLRDPEKRRAYDQFGTNWEQAERARQAGGFQGATGGFSSRFSAGVAPSRASWAASSPAFSAATAEALRRTHKSSTRRCLSIMDGAWKGESFSDSRSNAYALAPPF